MNIRTTASSRNTCLVETDMQATALAVDSQAVYVEGISSPAASPTTRAIFRQPFGASTAVTPLVGVEQDSFKVCPIFVDDGTYLYYQYADPVNAYTLERVAKGTAPAPETIGANFYYNSGPQPAITLDSSYAYIVGEDGGNGDSYFLTIKPQGSSMGIDDRKRRPTADVAS